METEELLDRDAACRFIGGSKPINPATLYRGIKRGLFPRPIHITPSISRWRRSELAEALARLADEREPSGKVTA